MPRRYCSGIYIKMGMNTFRFNSGIPPGCADWLRENVGKGQTPTQWVSDWAWEYERKTFHEYDDRGDLCGETHCPCITIRDETHAALFVLRWA